MNATILPGQIWRESEFVYDPVSKRWLTGTCGPNACAMAESWADQHYHATLDVYHRMRASGRCDANGAATMASLAEDALAAGYTLDLLPYREPMPEAEWRSFFAQHVGKWAVVFETANGQALLDAISGKGENARNLRYHFVLIVGWHPGGHSPRMNRDLPAGWWCSDGDNFATGNVLQFYPDTVLAAARPCAAMAIASRVHSSGGTGGAEAGVPAGWHDDGTTLTAPNGKRVILGFRSYLLTQKNWPSSELPLEDERHVAQLEWADATLGAGTRQIFQSKGLRWSEAQNVHEIALGAELLAVEAKLAAANQHLITAQHEEQNEHEAADAPAVAAVKALSLALTQLPQTQ